jgi:membrane associated rhomboid family serine protease
MGFESRDYARDGSYSARLGGWGMSLTPGVKYLIIANVAVFVLQMLLTRPANPVMPDFDQVWQEQEEPDVEADGPPARKAEKNTPADRRKREIDARKAREAMEEVMNNLPGGRTSIIQQWFELSPKKTVEKFQIWRLVTSAFLHDRYAIFHILINMVVLAWFGQRLESMYGTTEFVLFYLAGAVSSSLAYVALAYYEGSSTPAIGASGAVMAVMMLYVIFYPFEQYLLFWFIPLPLWALLGIYVLYDLHPVLLALAGEPMFTRVAHAGHLGGLLFGFVYWRFGWRLESIVARVAPRLASRPRAMPFPRGPGLRLRVVAPRDDGLAARVDEILKKISEHGKESLTDEERDILVKAAGKYRGEK